VPLAWLPSARAGLIVSRNRTEGRTYCHGTQAQDEAEASSEGVSVFRFPSRLDGLADKQTNARFCVDRRLSPFLRLETTVHEALHLADWKMSERKVTVRARYIARVLWAAGRTRLFPKMRAYTGPHRQASQGAAKTRLPTPSLTTSRTTSRSIPVNRASSSPTPSSGPCRNRSTRPAWTWTYSPRTPTRSARLVRSWSPSGNTSQNGQPERMGRQGHRGDRGVDRRDRRRSRQPALGHPHPDLRYENEYRKLEALCVQKGHVRPTYIERQFNLPANDSEAESIGLMAATATSAGTTPCRSASRTRAPTPSSSGHVSSANP